MREALRDLETLRFVESEPFRGARVRVSPPSSPRSTRCGCGRGGGGAGGDHPARRRRRGARARARGDVRQRRRRRDDATPGRRTTSASTRRSSRRRGTDPRRGLELAPRRGAHDHHRIAPRSTSRRSPRCTSRSSPRSPSGTPTRPGGRSAGTRRGLRRALLEEDYLTRLVDLSMPVHRDMLTFPACTAADARDLRELEEFAERIGAAEHGATWLTASYLVIQNDHVGTHSTPVKHLAARTPRASRESRSSTATRTASCSTSDDKASGYRITVRTRSTRRSRDRLHAQGA